MANYQVGGNGVAYAFRSPQSCTSAVQAESNANWQGGLPQQPRPPRAEDLVDNCRVRGMLDAIAWAEGTAGDADGGYGRVVRGTVLSAPHNPELVGQVNVTITDFTRHSSAKFAVMMLSLTTLPILGAFHYFAEIRKALRAWHSGSPPPRIID